MRRSFVLFLPVLAVMVAGLVAGEDRKEKAGGAKAPPAAEKGKVAKPMPLFDLDEFVKEYDANKDGFLSKDELPERFRHTFDKLDINNDGKLSREELQKGVVHMQSRRRPSDFVFILVEMSDCDECCAEEIQIVYEFIRKLDTNHDGKVDADELKVGREQLISRRVDAIFKDLDKNKYGKISREEARGQVKRHFDELDSDNDGFVSRDEVTNAAREKPGSLKKGGKEKSSEK